MKHYTPETLALAYDDLIRRAEEAHLHKNVQYHMVHAVYQWLFEFWTETPRGYAVGINLGPKSQGLYYVRPEDVTVLVGDLNWVIELGGLKITSKR